jgi:hypothetical protein
LNYNEGPALCGVQASGLTLLRTPCKAGASCTKLPFIMKVVNVKQIHPDPRAVAPASHWGDAAGPLPHPPLSAPSPGKVPAARLRRCFLACTTWYGGAGALTTSSRTVTPVTMVHPGLHTLCDGRWSCGEGRGGRATSPI